MSNTPENNKMFGVLVEKGSKNRKYAVFYPYKSIQEMLGTDRYDETKSYPQGTMVIYDKKLYKAVTNTTVGSWNPEEWVDADVEDVINNKQERITSTNKLSIDLIEESSSYKVMTSQEREKLSGIDERKLSEIDNKADKISVASTIPRNGMLPNVLYNLGTLTGTVTFSMASASDNTIANHWYWTFDTDTTVPNITWPNSVIKWIGNSLDNDTPNVEASTHYEVSIQNDYGIFNAF